MWRKAISIFGCKNCTTFSPRWRFNLVRIKCENDVEKWISQIAPTINNISDDFECLIVNNIDTFMVIDWICVLRWKTLDIVGWNLQVKYLITSIEKTSTEFTIHEINYSFIVRTEEIIRKTFYIYSNLHCLLKHSRASHTIWKCPQKNIVRW